MGAPPSNSVEIPNVTCPFCGLLCDDLTVTRTGGSLEVTSGPCAIAARGFAGVPAPSAPMARIRGESTTVDAAIAEAARLLSQARQPLLGGLSTDLAGARAAARLADRVGGVVDHMNSAVSLRNLLVLQDGGWVTTTLSEVRNHADLLVIVGSDISRRHPRLVERTVLHRETLYDSERSCRLLLLGVEPGSIELAGARVPVDTVPCRREDLPEALGLLRAAINGRTPHSSIAGVPTETWATVAQSILSAQYAVFVWAAADFDFPHAELAIQTLAELVKDVNRTTRAAGLPLIGADGEVTVDAVLHWQSGYGARTSYGAGYPAHDSYHLGAGQLLEGKDADLLLWVASFDGSRVPPATGVPQIVLGRADMTLAAEPEVFIAVGIPGVDHPGHLFRGDRVIALPLFGLRETQLPTVAGVLDGIATTLGAP